MKRFRHLLVLLALMICPAAFGAAVSRHVSGKVVDAYGEPIPGVKIMVNDINLCVFTDQKGEFSIEVTASSTRLMASFRHYKTEERPLDGSEYIVFKLLYDFAYAADFQREQERMAHERKLAAQAKAKADHEAVLQAAAARRQAEQQARREAARAKAAAYDEHYRNHGFAQGLELGGAYQLAPKANVCYANAGWYTYSCLFPVTVTYTLGWRVNNFVFLGAGAGFLWNITDLSKAGDSFDPLQKLSYRNFDIPVFANAKFYLSRTAIQPMVSASAGYYLMSRTFMWDGGAGVNFRCGRRCGTYVLAGVGSTPWPHFHDTSLALVDRYKSMLSVNLKVGFSF